HDVSGLAPTKAASSVLPVDTIADAPATPAVDPAQPVKAAAWSETSTAPAAADKLTGWSDKTTIEPLPPVKAAEADKAAAPAAPVKVADGWNTESRRVVSPAPVGPPPVRAAGPPVVWGPAVVVSAGPSGGPTGFEPYLLDTGDKLRVFVY